MTKRRSLISYDKMSPEQKKELEKDFPEGFLASLTTMKTPMGEMFDGLLWEKEDIIYLVRINKAAFISALEDEDETDELEDLDDDVVVDEEAEHVDEEPEDDDD